MFRVYLETVFKNNFMFFRFENLFDSFFLKETIFENIVF